MRRFKLHVLGKAKQGDGAFKDEKNSRLKQSGSAKPTK